MATEFEQIFGYNPIDEWKNLSNFQKKGSLGNSISPLVDAQLSYMSQQQTNEANKNLAQMNNDYNTMMWEKQNEFNSPQATMQRLVDAGINPRAYQQIGQFANAEAPKPAEKVDYESPLGKLAKFSEQAQIRLAYKQMKLDELRLTTDTFDAVSDKIRSYYNLQETKRFHNIQHTLGLQRNEIMKEHYDNIDNYNMNALNISYQQHILNEDRFVSDLAKMGIKYDKENRTFDVPDYIVNMPKQERQAALLKVMEETSKIIEERELLLQTGDIRGDKHEFEQKTRVYREILAGLRELSGFIPKMSLKLN